MIIVMKPGVPRPQVKAVIKFIEDLKLRPVLMEGVERNVIAIIGEERNLSVQTFQAMSGVDYVMPVLKPYKLAALETAQKPTVIDVCGVKIGGNKLCVMAGPCSVESEKQLIETALVVKKAGATILRGGAFKPRTSPYAFQGMGEEGLKLLRHAKKETGLPIITELMDIRDVVLIEKYADIIQIGARNSQNFPLLKEVGRAQKPVFLKRGISGTIEELLMSAEYIMSEGNPNVILCERGIRTFERATRNTFDVNAIPVLKKLTHLPVIADPSHGTGEYSLVTPIAKAGIAAGADGLMIEVHLDPKVAVSDGGQSLTEKNFIQLMTECKRIAKAVDRTM